MFGSMKVLSVIAGLGLMAGLMAMPVRAEEAAKETGTVSGTVVDARGNAVADVNVTLLDKSQLPGGPKREAKAADDDAKPKRAKPTPRASSACRTCRSVNMLSARRARQAALGPTSL
jgi:hypothetical protein